MVPQPEGLPGSRPACSGQGLADGAGGPRPATAPRLVDHAAGSARLRFAGVAGSDDPQPAPQQEGGSAAAAAGRTDPGPLGFAALVVVALSLFLLASLLGDAWRCAPISASPALAASRSPISCGTARVPPCPGSEGWVPASSARASVAAKPAAPRSCRARCCLWIRRAALAASVQAAGEAGESVPAPRLEVRERNWLVGVDQRVWLDLDLRELPPLPAVDLSIGLESVRAAAVRHAEPETVQAAIGSRLIWPLRLGSLNRLELRCWRWSPLGLGGCAIALLLPLVLGLQRQAPAGIRPSRASGVS